jgi:hypothetical protein
LTGAPAVGTTDGMSTVTVERMVEVTTVGGITGTNPTGPVGRMGELAAGGASSGTADDGAATGELSGVPSGVFEGGPEAGGPEAGGLAEETEDSLEAG